MPLPMIQSSQLAEALLLGLASGPACVASCGPVLIPSLLAEDKGWRLNARYLVTFLSTRLLGYLLFAAVAWKLGSLVSIQPSVRTAVFGTIHLLLAAALLWYARAVGRPCAKSCTRSELVTIGAAGKRGIPGAAVFGFLTGVSLCPPFLAAGVRAAELGSVTAALLFFAVFFVGTSVWFVPFVGLSCVQRNDAVTTVARMTLVLIAAYYGSVGILILVGRHRYGY
jgi:sulfite exporter TauE/SafE